MLGRGRAGQKAREQLGIKDCIVVASQIHADHYDPSKIDTYPDFMHQSIRHSWHESRQDVAYEAFKEGAKWGIDKGYAELLEENYDLHGRILHLCDKFMVKPCPTCNAEGLKNPPDDLEECETCNGDCWIPNVN